MYAYDVVVTVRICDADVVVLLTESPGLNVVPPVLSVASAASSGLVPIDVSNVIVFVLSPFGAAILAS